MRPPTLDAFSVRRTSRHDRVPPPADTALDARDIPVATSVSVPVSLSLSVAAALSAPIIAPLVATSVSFTVVPIVLDTVVGACSRHITITVTVTITVALVAFAWVDCVACG
jgi:hypothetical protein